jgi:tRNA (guanine-N7-)-methyltransferase
MARLRNASRVWRGDEACAAAARMMVADAGPVFTIEPAALFARPAPLEIELGAGRGDFIITRAAATPEVNFIAAEIAGTVARLLAVRAGRERLNNLRVAQMDARTLVNLMIATASVSAYHIYFPDPWPRKRDVKHRLFTPWFVASLKRTLRPGAPLYLATDVADYAGEIFAMLAAAGFASAEMVVPGAETTGFARKFRAEGRPVYGGAFVAAK